MLIIGIIGQNRVGKDTSGEFLNNFASQKYGFTFKKYALADPIKDVARIMFNFTEDQLYGNEKDKLDPYWNIKPRDFFQKFGTEIMQYDIYKYLPIEFHNSVPSREFWVKSMFRKIEKDQEEYIMVTDVRGNHEARKIIEQGGYLIEIIREKKEDFQYQYHIEENEDTENHNNYTESNPYLNNFYNNKSSKIYGLMQKYIGGYIFGYVNRFITSFIDGLRNENLPSDYDDDHDNHGKHGTHITEIEAKMIKKEYIFATVNNIGTLDELKTNIELIFTKIINNYQENKKNV